MKDPDYSYDDLVTRARCGQHTLRQCLMVIEGLKTQLQIAAALAEVTVPKESRSGAVGQYVDDFPYIFALLDEVIPDAEKVADLMWEGPSDFEEPRTFQLLPGFKPVSDELHAADDCGEIADGVVKGSHLSVIDGDSSN